MKQSFKYRPPFFYLAIAFGSAYVSFIMLKALLISFSTAEIGLVIIFAFFGIALLGIGAGFSIIFFKNILSGDLVMNDESIEIPGRWKKRSTIRFKDISSVNEIDSYDTLLQIVSKKGVRLIEKKWMNKNDFEILKETLKSKILAQVS
jgi:hypothetical protein